MAQKKTKEDEISSILGNELTVRVFVMLRVTFAIKETYFINYSLAYTNNTSEAGKFELYSADAFTRCLH